MEQFPSISRSNEMGKRKALPEKVKKVIMSDNSPDRRKRLQEMGRNAAKVTNNKRKLAEGIAAVEAQMFEIARARDQEQEEHDRREQSNEHLHPFDIHE